MAEVIRYGAGDGEGAKRPPHRLSAIDPDARRAICSVCGPVSIRSRGANAGWRCAWTDHLKARDRRVGAARRLKSYNLTSDEYEALVEKQQGRCAACGQECNSFHIDHDHKCCAASKQSCGKCIRGLLCSDCNRMLGFAHDDPAKLRAAAKYLEDTHV